MNTLLLLQPPDPRYAIRPVRFSDAVLLHHHCWPGQPIEFVQRLITRAQRVAQQNYGLGIVVVIDGGAVAYGQFTLWPRCGEISDLMVCEERRGQGIGTAMVQYLVRTAREMQVPCVEIGAMLDNPKALALYQRLGFQESHRVQLHLEGTPVEVQYLRFDLDGAGGQNL